LDCHRCQTSSKWEENFTKTEMSFYEMTRKLKIFPMKLSSKSWLENLLNRSFPRLKFEEKKKNFVVVLSDLVFLLFFTPFSLWNKVDYIFLKFSFNFAVVKTKYCESRFCFCRNLTFNWTIKHHITNIAFELHMPK
jgi:hypothetical protein